MKPGIHPDYHPVVFQDANTGTAFLTRSTITSPRTIDWETPEGVRSHPLVVVDVSAESHPFWTGSRRVMDTAGRVEKFRRRYGERAGRTVVMPHAEPRLTSSSENACGTCPG